jgi:hypothetical protein
VNRSNIAASPARRRWYSIDAVSRASGALPPRSGRYELLALADRVSALGGSLMPLPAGRWSTLTGVLPG